MIVQPKTLIKTGRRELAMELSMLYVVAMVAAVHLLGLSWLLALVVAPLLSAAVVLGLMLLVEVLWLTVAGLDRCGSALGMRKSPLS